jgi:hypothetical protein
MNERSTNFHPRPLRVVAALELFALAAGASFGGLALNGAGSALDLHMIAGAAAMLLAVAQLAVCLARPAPRRLRLLSLALLLAVAAQAASGAMHVFALHLPLALAIFAGEAALVVAPAFEPKLPAPGLRQSRAPSQGASR